MVGIQVVLVAAAPSASKGKSKSESDPGFCPWCGRLVAGVHKHIEETCAHPYLQWYFDRMTPDLERKMNGVNIWKADWEAFKWPETSRPTWTPTP